MASAKAELVYAFSLLGVIVTRATPAYADDADFRKHAEQIASAYTTSFNNDSDPSVGNGKIGGPL